MARFGSFEVDDERRQLLHQGEPVHLTPKAFDLLQLLIRAAPRVVAKAELHAALWPTSFVADATLVGLVKELRRALNDHDPETPIIRTVHRVGYAFCPPIESAAAPAAPRGWLVCDERRIALVAGVNVIGRDPACDVWLDAATVSRRHARIVVSDNGVELEDLGSTNGTKIGGTALEGRTALHDGDELRFGKVLATYRASTASFPTAPVMTWATTGPPRERVDADS